MTLSYRQFGSWFEFTTISCKPNDKHNLTMNRIKKIITLCRPCFDKDVLGFELE